MSSTTRRQKSVFKRSQKKAVNEQKPKQKIKKAVKSKVFPWKLLFGVVAIISVMTLLSNPVDPSFDSNESSKSNRSGLNGFSLEK